MLPMCYCFLQAGAVEKSKQIFEIRHVQIDELPWTLVYAFIWLRYSDKSESFEECITFMHYFFNYIIWSLMKLHFLALTKYVEKK